MVIFSEGVTVHKYILSILLLSGISVWAQADANIVNETISDADLAEIRVVVTDIGEPVYAPLQLKISVLCKDNRVNKNGPAPRWTLAREAQAICAFGSHAYNADRKVLALKFSEAAIVVGDAPCEPQPAKSIDIKKACARWNK